MNAHAASLSALAQSLRARGVVGAGGAGQPLADKLLARPYRTLIINAAQSEPLFSKDWAVLAANAECVFTGARVLRDALGLAKVFLATRDEFAGALPELAALARKHQVALARLHLRLPDGRLLDGAAAFAGLWRLLPRWAWLGRLLGTGWRLRAVAEPYIVCTHAQTPEAILAPKQLCAEALQPCHALGQALAEGLALGVF